MQYIMHSVCFTRSQRLCTCLSLSLSPQIRSIIIMNMNMKIRINIVNFHFDHDRHILFVFSFILRSRSFSFYIETVEHIYMCTNDACINTLDTFDRMRCKSANSNTNQPNIINTFQTRNARIFPSSSSSLSLSLSSSLFSVVQKYK